MAAITSMIAITTAIVILACGNNSEPSPLATEAQAKDRIRISADNPRYFEWHGQPIYLLGATESGPESCGTANGWMAISSGFEWQQDLEHLLDRGGNYTRVIPYFPNQPIMPWVTVEDGLYDLNQINPEWLARLRGYLQWTEDHDIVVQLEIFDNYSYKDAAWLDNPFNPNKNVNYGPETVAAESQREDIAIYRTVPEKQNDALILLEHYVSTLVLQTLPYGNVIYSISNESNARLDWPEYWANYIHRLAESRGYDVLVGEMPHGFEPTTGVDPIADSPDFDFVDASSFTSEDRFGDNDPGAILAGTDDVLTELAARAQKPVTVGKIYYRSAPTLWSKFINGSASARFHRDCDRGGSDEENPERYFDYLRNLRSFVDELDLTTVNTLDDNIVTGAPEDVQVDVMGAQGAWYAIHLYRAEPTSGLQIDLTLPDGTYSGRWYDPGTGTWTPAEMESGTPLAVPEFESDMALLVERDGAQ